MAEADGRANSLIQYVDEVVRNCDVCKAFDSAPAIPVAGTSSVSAFNEKLQVDLLFLDDLIVLHVLDLFSRYSLLVPARSENPEEVWDAFCNSWIAVFGKPRIIQMDEGGERKNDLWAYLCTDRYIKLLFQGGWASSLDPGKTEWTCSGNL